jgi:hypothetical protein
MSDDRKKDPVLDIPVADAFDPQPTIIELKFDTPREFQGDYGPRYAYSIKHKGTDHVLFASQALDGAIYQTGAQKGDRVAIIRTGTGQDTRWKARLVDENGRAVEGKTDRPAKRPKADDTQARQQTATSASSGGQRTMSKSFDERLTDFLNDETLYLHAMQRAMTALPEDAPKPSLDLNAVAFVLYKMAKDHDITLDPKGEPIVPEFPEETLTEQQQSAKDAIISVMSDKDGAPDNPLEVEKDALSLIQALNDRDTTWATLPREKAIEAHRYAKGATDYIAVLTGAQDELPF